MSQALYRKYRSRKFDDVVGQKHVTDLLAEAVKRGTFAHAYLFTGPRGTGKTSVARILAHAINKLPYDDDNTHLDIIEIDAASNRRIDDVRDLREKVHIAPSSAKFKVYIIDEAHMLTSESFNALLKTLEEPPAHAVFVLATTEIHKVPPTIVSRTQRFHFRPGSEEAIIQHLKTIAKQEKINITDGALKIIALHSEGGFRDSLSLLDQASSITKAQITEADLTNLLGLAPHDYIRSILNNMAIGETKLALETVSNLIDEGISAITIVEQLIREIPEFAKNQTSLYSFMGDLLEVGKSNAATLKLISLVATYKPDTSELQSPRKPEVVPSNTKPSPKNSVQEDTKPPVVTKHKPAISKNPTQSDKFDWEVILKELKNRLPAIYSVAKRAEITHDSNVLTLNFAYSLHQKKMKDKKYISELQAIILETCGVNMEIEIKDARSKALDSTAAAVADIMGGGEAI